MFVKIVDLWILNPNFLRKKYLWWRSLFGRSIGVRGEFGVWVHAMPSNYNNGSLIYLKTGHKRKKKITETQIKIHAPDWYGVVIIRNSIY